MATNAIKPSVVGPVLTDKADYILKALRDCRNHIKVLSDEIADKECEAAAVQDELAKAKAKAFVDAATVTRPDGKLAFPNIDAQKAQAELTVHTDEYDAALAAHRHMLNEIQKWKNLITCEHERRGDLKNEIELLKLLATEAN
jgi:hypothetical protein